MKRQGIGLALFGLWAGTLAADIDRAAADRAFAELDAMCRRGNSSLWAAPICGPTIFVERKSRQFVSNDPSRPSGVLPEAVGIANTAVDWDGRRWTMVMWPLPDQVFERRSLLAHESYHRVQDRPAAAEGTNAHLDTIDGRYLMQLEWRALAAALAGEKEAINDALRFRARRHVLFPSAAQEERALEMHEGLAEYTGTRMAVPPLRERIALLIGRLQRAENTPSFVRSFAYASSPAWGALLEERRPRWTRTLSEDDDIPDLVRRAYGVVAMEERRSRYDGNTLLARERAREEERQQFLSTARSRYVDGPTLTLPLRAMQMQFDPNRVRPFESRGTVYGVITIRDDWGKIVVNDGALISSDFTKLIVPLADEGRGWTLIRSEGWNVVEGGRSGHKTVSSRK